MMQERLETYISLICKSQVQKQLQLRIEAQGRYLKRIIDQQQRRNMVIEENPSNIDDAQFQTFQQCENSEDLMIQSGSHPGTPEHEKQIKRQKDDGYVKQESNSN